MVGLIIFGAALVLSVGSASVSAWRRHRALRRHAARRPGELGPNELAWIKRRQHDPFE
jgi:hypothetical protein